MHSQSLFTFKDLNRLFSKKIIHICFNLYPILFNTISKIKLMKVIYNKSYIFHGDKEILAKQKFCILFKICISNRIKMKSMDWYGNKFRNSLCHKICLIIQSKATKSCTWKLFGYVKMKQLIVLIKINTKIKKNWKIKNKNKSKSKAGWN